MGLARLDDAEYARRSRERNNRINAAHRQRLLQAGKAQTNVWLSAALRTRLDDEAVAEGVSLSAVVERLLSAALTVSPIGENSPKGEFAKANPDTADLFATGEIPQATELSTGQKPPAESYPQPVDKSVNTDLAARNRRILELHRQGVSTREIARLTGVGKSTTARIVKLATAT